MESRFAAVPTAQRPSRARAHAGPAQKTQANDGIVRRLHSPTFRARAALPDLQPVRESSLGAGFASQAGMLGPSSPEGFLLHLLGLADLVSFVAHSVLMKVSAFVSEWRAFTGSSRSITEGPNLARLIGHHDIRRGTTQGASPVRPVAATSRSAVGVRRRRHTPAAASHAKWTVDSRRASRRTAPRGSIAGMPLLGIPVRSTIRTPQAQASAGARKIGCTSHLAPIGVQIPASAHHSTSARTSSRSQ